jgi:hypothetical protein
MNADPIDIKIKTRLIDYGVAPTVKTFAEARILFCYRGRIVGVEDGPKRTFVDRRAAEAAAKERAAELWWHRLYVIDVARKHIADGEARSCYSCAIAQALWHNQERMGFRKGEWSFEVVPYACFTDARGIVLQQRFGGDEARLDAEQLPDVVPRNADWRVYTEGMVQWAIEFDDWADARHMTLREWRQKTSYDEDYKPPRPWPMSFVLDLDAFRFDEPPEID